MTRNLHVYKIIENGGAETSHVIAESPEAAVAALKRELELGDDDDLKPVELPDDSTLTTTRYADDEDDNQSDVTFDDTRTCAEWCYAEGPGVLCATYF